MFLPNVKNQKVYHFTNYGRAFKEAFRFNVEEPTSLLYKRADNGKLTLVGAMYTMPQRAGIDRLNDRVPLSIARWHKHVNWCLPKKGDEARGSRRKTASRSSVPNLPCDESGVRCGERRISRKPLRLDAATRTSTRAAISRRSSATITAAGMVSTRTK
jgi:hypothetical protein